MRAALPAVLATLCLPAWGMDATTAGARAVAAPPPAAAGSAAAPTDAAAGGSWVPAATMSAGMVRFSAELWRRVAAREGDLAIAPLSIYGALSMTACGARGRTLSEMERVLDQRISIADARRWTQVVDGLAPSSVDGRPAWTWTMACGLFPRQDLPIDPGFAACCRDRFHGALMPQDYLEHQADAIQAINGWTSDATHGLIRTIVGPDCVTSATRLILTSAQYFSAAWQNPFPPERTTLQPFHGSAQVDQVPTMHAVLRLQYGEVSGTQVVSLPYADGAMDCLLVVPAREDGLRAIERGLDGPLLARLCAAPVAPRLVSLALPRAQVGARMQLQEALADMGMHAAFDGARADFGALSAQPLSLGQVVQSTVLEVTERGTAAAAAAVVDADGADVQQLPPVAVTADHPFLLIVRHQPSGALLFMARISNPVPGGPAPAAGKGLQ